MGISRRTFLSVATGAVAGMLPTKTATGSVRYAQGGPFGGAVAGAREHVGCVLLNAQEHCALPESLAGYESALRAAGVGFVKVSAGPLPRAKTILIPACLALPPHAAGEVAAALKDGSCVVLECGAGFAAPKAFAAHQQWLREAWSVEVKTPVDLWKPDGSSALRRRSNNQLGRAPVLAPYLDFHWPLRVKVRDFSRAVPVPAPAAHVVGWCGDWPIASRDTRGKGSLVLLGSPVGPALWAGDAEAHRWFREVLGARETSL